MVPTTSELDRTTRQVRPRRRIPVWVAAIEVALAVAAVLLDLFLPSLVLVALAAVSLLVRREHLATLGVHRLAHPARSALQILAVVVGWTVLQLALLMPLAEHLTGQRQDVSQFTEVEGNLTLLLTMLALSWTLAAIVEELAFRGYLLTRLTELFSGGTTPTPAGRTPRGMPVAPGRRSARGGPCWLPCSCRPPSSG
jgi:membrane protease YdiL (CAAX protease family)